MSIISLTADELIRKWRLYHYREPEIELTAQVTRTDGIDVNQIMLLEAQHWYDNLLHTAPERLLKVSDLSAEVQLTSTENGVWHCKLSENVVRLTRVRLTDWERDAMIVTDPYSHAAKLQSCEQTRSGAAFPVAVFSRSTLMVYSKNQPQIMALEGIVQAENRYEMDEKALLTMKNDESNG